MYKYAVVHWYNYRKELHAGFLKSFHDFEEANKYAYELAKKDIIEYNDNGNGNGNGNVITEDEITDINGPGKYGSPYKNKSIVGYGGRYSTGYCTSFYCVVEWFEGVTNEWNDFEDDEYWMEKYGDQWYPKY
jgi:hypothetical protein